MFSETNSKSLFKKSLLSAISRSKTKNSRTQKHKMQNTKHPCGICQKKVSEKIRLHVFVLYVNIAFILLNVTSLPLQSIIY